MEEGGRGHFGGGVRSSMVPSPTRTLVDLPIDLKVTMRMNSTRLVFTYQEIAHDARGGPEETVGPALMPLSSTPRRRRRQT
jgi:hypothetical protein